MYFLLAVLGGLFKLKKLSHPEMARRNRCLQHLPAANHHNYEGVTMTEEKLAQMEHISQLLIFQLKRVHNHLGKAWYEMELARSDLRDLMELHEACEKEQLFEEKSPVQF